MFILGVSLLAACTPPPASSLARPGEAASCREALAVRQDALDRIDEAHQRTVGAGSGSRAALDAIRDEARSRITAVAALAACEDGTSATGVSIDLAQLRDQLGTVADEYARRLTTVAPAPPREEKRRVDDDDDGRDKKDEKNGKRD